MTGKWIDTIPSNLHSEALKYAYGIRENADKEYWTRAAYFWTLLAAAFAGYAAAFVWDDKGDDKLIYNRILLLLVISSMGFLLSWAWYLVNRGSKFWMVHWEDKVRELQKEVTGPLFQVNKSELDKYDICKWLKLWGPYPYSVSKINCLISLYAAGLWLAIWVYSLITAHSIIPCWSKEILTIVMLGLWLLLTFGKITPHHNRVP